MSTTDHRGATAPRRLIAWLLLVVAMAASLLVTASPAAAGDKEMVPMSVVVKLAVGNLTDLTTLAADFDATEIEPLIASRGLYLVHTDHEMEIDDKDEAKAKGDADKWLKNLRKDWRVVWAELDVRQVADDLRFHAWPEGEPIATALAATVDQPAFDDLDIAEAHERARGAGVRIAVLDTGADLSHPLLAGHLSTGYDMVDDDDDPSEQANGLDDDGDGNIDEAHGHGTFVAGIIAQVAPGAQIIPIRVLDADGSAEIFAVIEAIDLAIELEADVINMSFGLLSRGKLDAFDDALKRAKDADVVIVAAAGNSGDGENRYPASNKNVISVGALDEQGSELAWFSNHGKWVSLAAPGVDIVSSVPGGGYAEWAGTSMATPIAAGFAGILTEANRPRDKAKEVVKALLDGASKMRGKQRAEDGAVDILSSLDKLK